MCPFVSKTDFSLLPIADLPAGRQVERSFDHGFEEYRTCLRQAGKEQGMSNGEVVDHPYFISSTFLVRLFVWIFDILFAQKRINERLIMACKRSKDNAWR
jgi:hypothetical protein